MPPAATEATEARRRGRPVRPEGDAPSTRQRLVRAAAEVCVERGFEGATVGDIARRADVTSGAIYNHFGGKIDLLVAAGHDALDRLDAEGAERAEPDRIVRRFLHPDFTATRRLLAELHLASARHPRLAELLGAWHRQQAERLRSAGLDEVSSKTLFVMLMGCCHADVFDDLAGSRAEMTTRLAEGALRATTGAPARAAHAAIRPLKTVTAATITPTSRRIPR
jgi:AcrR family transcriptional regulator